MSKLLKFLLNNLQRKLNKSEDKTKLEEYYKLLNKPAVEFDRTPEQQKFASDYASEWSKRNDEDVKNRKEYEKSKLKR